MYLLSRIKEASESSQSVHDQADYIAMYVIMTSMMQGIDPDVAGKAGADAAAAHLAAHGATAAVALTPAAPEQASYNPQNQVMPFGAAPNPKSAAEAEAVGVAAAVSAFAVSAQVDTAAAVLQAGATEAVAVARSNPVTFKGASGSDVQFDDEGDAIWSRLSDAQKDLLLGAPKKHINTLEGDIDSWYQINIQNLNLFNIDS